MTGLVKYEAACLAIAECKTIDEVKDWADKAAAMQAYQRMAQDKTLELDASEIRIRAERRLGQLLAATKAEGGLAPAATLKQGPVVVGGDHGKPTPKLADLGVSKDLSSRAQKLAAVPAAEFEGALATKREAQAKEGARVTARLESRGAAVLAEQNDDCGPSAEEMADAEQSARDDAARVSLLLDSDAPLKAMTEKATALQHQVRILESRIAGLMREKDEAVKAAKRWQKQAEAKKP